MRLHCVLLFLATLVIASPARADENEAAAQLLYEEAKGLIDAGNHAEACPKLEKSLAIEEAMGARFLLAECYEKVGKLASAWNNYVKVAEQAHREGQDERERYARDRAEAMRARVATVTLVLDPATKALELEVLRNGEPISSALVEAPIPLDPGSHTFEIRAAGHRPFEASIDIAGEGSAETLAIPALEPLPADTTAPSPTPDPTTADGGANALLISGIVVGGVGIVAIGASIGIGFSAKNSYYQALDDHCDGLECNSRGVSQTEDAIAQGNVATAIFGVGAGLAAVGVVLTIIGVTSGDDGGDEGDVAFRAAPTLDGGGFAALQGAF